jgi:hypothetical protein
MFSLVIGHAGVVSRRRYFFRTQKSHHAIHVAPGPAVYDAALFLILADEFKYGITHVHTRAFFLESKQKVWAVK